MLKNLLIKLPQALFVLLMSAFLASCSPTYKVVHDFTPPASKAGSACISGCINKHNQCKSRCSSQYSQCSIRAEQQAESEFPEMMRAYTGDLEHWTDAKETYDNALERYEFRVDLAEARLDRRYDRCIGKGETKKACSKKYNYKDITYKKPKFDDDRPKKPSLTSETAKIRNANCTQSCGCDNTHRLCYSSCGGIVKSRKVCVKHCD